MQLKHPVKNQIAFCNGKWALPVIVDAENNVFYNTETNLIIPFVTEDKYTFLDAYDLKSVVAKLILAERKVEVLKQKVEDNYSSDYLLKFYKEKNIDIPEFNVVHHIISHYSTYLKDIFGDSEWAKKNQAINSNENLRFIEKDVERVKLFMEYLETQKQK